MEHVLVRTSFSELEDRLRIVWSKSAPIHVPSVGDTSPKPLFRFISWLPRRSGRTTVLQRLLTAPLDRTREAQFRIVGEKAIVATVIHHLSARFTNPGAHPGDHRPGELRFVLVLVGALRAHLPAGEPLYAGPPGKRQRSPPHTKRTPAPPAKSRTLRVLLSRSSRRWCRGVRWP